MACSARFTRRNADRNRTRGSNGGTVEHFSENYADARARFLDGAARAGALVESIEAPFRGPNGERLSMDAALLGDSDADRTLVLTSGIHGVEGFAGSAIQTELLQERIDSELADGVNLLMIHAVNPYGMAHCRRFNEDNVDLNRNFRDHARPYPRNGAYEDLAPALAPESLSPWSEARSWTRLLTYRLLAGKTSTTAAVTAGQHVHPEGLFFGGTSESWSNRTLRSLLSRRLAESSHIVFVDIHTGLGRFCEAEILLHAPIGSPEFQRAVYIWGPSLVRSTVDGGSVSVHLDASAKIAVRQMFRGAEVTAATLEIGTVSSIRVLKALRAENWLHHHGGKSQRRARHVKARLLRSFVPTSDRWRDQVRYTGGHVVRDAVAFLSTDERVPICRIGDSDRDEGGS